MQQVRRPLLLAATSVALAVLSTTAGAWGAQAAQEDLTVTAGAIVRADADELTFALHRVNASTESIGGIRLSSTDGTVECTSIGAIDPGNSTECTITVPIDDAARAAGSVTVAVDATGFAGRAERPVASIVKVTETWPIPAITAVTAGQPDTSVPPIPETSVPPIPETSVPPIPETSVPPIPETTVPPIPVATLNPIVVAQPVPENPAIPPADDTVTPNPVASSRVRATPAAAVAQLAVTGGALEMGWPLAGGCLIALGATAMWFARRRSPQV